MMTTPQRICGNFQQSLSNNFHLVFSVMNPYLFFCLHNQSLNFSLPLLISGLSMLACCNAKISMCHKASYKVVVREDTTEAESVPVVTSLLVGRAIER